MPPGTHDYSDSEGDSPLLPATSTLPDSAHVAGPSKPPSSSKSESHPLRITLRPNLTHLVNPSSGPGAALVPPSDRSSLSPPPPITLKFGMKHAALAKASYSSSSSDEDDAEAEAEAEAEADGDGDGDGAAAPPSKKSKSESSVPAQHRKTYDWLQPGTAAASHHGPPPRLSGWTPEGSGEPTPQKKSKKRSGEGAVGPGKAWRKGLKKGMAIPWKEGGTFRADGSIGYSTPPGSYPLSREGTPEPALAPADTAAPFVVADPSTLDFPVYRKPIVAPKVTLGNFPKVTAFFFQDNGGDSGPFPRKEKARNWKLQERAIVGVGGGRLRVKTWHMGPPSELGRILQAEKEARDLAKSRKSAAATPSERLSMPPAQAPEAERPEDDASEIGDGEESNAGSIAVPIVAPVPLPLPAIPKPKAKAPKAKPRKSKLAQEIVPPEPDPDPDPEPKPEPEPESERAEAGRGRDPEPVQETAAGLEGETDAEAGSTPRALGAG